MNNFSFCISGPRFERVEGLLLAIQNLNIGYFSISRTAVGFGLLRNAVTVLPEPQSLAEKVLIRVNSHQSAFNRLFNMQNNETSPLAKIGREQLELQFTGWSRQC